MVEPPPVDAAAGRGGDLRRGAGGGPLGSFSGWCEARGPRIEAGLAKVLRAAALTRAGTIVYIKGASVTEKSCRVTGPLKMVE